MCVVISLTQTVNTNTGLNGRTLVCSIGKVCFVQVYCCVCVFVFALRSDSYSNTHI